MQTCAVININNNNVSLLKLISDDKLPGRVNFQIVKAKR